MKIIITLSIICFQLSAFAQNTYEYIPNSVAYIMGINFSQIESKSNGMDYSKYLESFTSKSMRYYDYRSYENGDICSLIDLKIIMKAPEKYGVDIKENVYIYQSKVKRKKGTVYLFKLNDVKLFEESLNTKCYKPTQSQIRNLSHGKTFLTEKMSVAIEGNTAVIYVRENSYYYDYAIEATEESNSDDISFVDSAYQSEKTLNNHKIDSAFYERLNNNKITDYESEIEKHKKNADTMILFRAEQRQMARMMEMMQKKFDEIQSLIITFVQIQPEHVGGNRNFNKLLSEKHDAFIFLNTLAAFNRDYLNPFGNYYYDEVEELTQNKTTTMSENIHSAYSIDFENGKATVNLVSTYNKKVYEYIKKAYDVKQDKKLFKYIDGSNLIGYMSMAVNNKELAKFYEDFYLEMINNIPKRKREMNYIPAIEMVYAFVDKEMLYNTLDGRVILACTGFADVKLKYSSYDYDEEFNRNEITEEKIVKQPRMVLAASVGNKENAQKLFDILSRFTVFTKLKDNVLAFYGSRYDPVNVYLALTEDALIISNDVNVVLNQLGGYSKKQQISSAEKKIITSHNFAVKINADLMMNGIKDNYFKEVENSSWFSSFMNKFGDVTLLDSKPTDSGYGFKAVLTLKDQSSNALYQLLQMMQSRHGH